MSRHTEPQLELHMPEEERVFETNLFRFRCTCGYIPALERKDGQYRMACGMPKNRSGFYHVGHLNHTDPTPWLPSSQQAIQHWKLVAALSKL